MKQHLHNKIGNVVGERKRALYDSLKDGADVERAIDTFIEEVSAELQTVVSPEQFPDAFSTPEKPVTEPPENPVRLREDLAAAVSEILTNDMAPPRLRDAVRDYVTDAPVKEEAPEPAETIYPEPNVKLPYGPESCEFIERLARESLQDCEQNQHMALLELLTYIQNDPSWGMWARNAIISASTDLRDKAADVLVALTQQQRRPAKGESK